MLSTDPAAIWIAQGENPCYLLFNQANRHGLVAGASGTGKTVTVKALAQGFSQAGVPVFVADVKGDLTGVGQAADPDDALRERLNALGATAWQPAACPMRIWDMLDDQGVPVRITVSDMGPVLLGRLLGLSDVQQGVLNIAFCIADEEGLLLIDLKDLRSMLTHVSDHAKEIETTYGRVSSQSVGAILRALLSAEDQGAGVFFGEPALELSDLMACDASGQGYVNLLRAERLMSSPQVYAMFLLWMITELFETLPEAGDPDKPKLVFFFDEAHLLFNDMPKALCDKLVQVVKLIRSKGVGLYFISQSTSDIPDEVLAQLSNRIQHGLRAYTPAEQKTVRATAEAFRENPAFDAADALLELGTGEALVSCLDAKGKPCVVERAMVIAPECTMGAATPETVQAILAAQQGLMGKYGTAVDRESAYEKLAAQAAEASEAAKLAEERAKLEAERAAFEKQKAAEEAKAAKAAEREAARAQAAAEKAAIKEAERQARAEQKRQKQMMRTVGSIVGQIGRTTGNQLIRGIFGSLRR